MEPTLRAAMGHVPGCGTAGTISQTVSSLAERVIKMMFLARLTLVVAASLTASTAIAAVVLAWPAPAVAPAIPDPPKAGLDDLAGRVVDESGAGVAGVQVWGMDGDWFTPDVVAQATTDDQGRYFLPGVAHLVGPAGRGQSLRVFVRARDGRVGWQRPVRQGRADPTGGEVELLVVGDARGRLTDQDGQPLTGVEVAPAGMSRTDTDFVWISPAVRALFRTTTAADGSFVLRGIPRGAGLYATIAAPKFGSPMVSWEPTQAVAIALDSRLGRIRGRLRPPDGRGLDRSFPLALKSPPQSASSPRPFTMLWSGDTSTAPDGTFQFDGLPPGRYRVWAYFDQDGIIAEKPETEVEVRPGGVATVEIALRRLPRVTGRVVDARTGRGVAGISLHSLWRELGRNMVVGQATTDAEGRYTIPARPGKNAVQITGLPKTYLIQDGIELPILQVEADKVVPDVKLVPAAELGGTVVDQAGHPVPRAEVYFLVADRPRARWDREPLRTGADGTFHLDQLDPDDKVRLWARAGDATTKGTIVASPREGKVTLTVDPKYTVRLRGLVTDSGGRRIAGAQVSLWWTRWYPPEKNGRPMMASSSVQDTYTTGANGLFVFRGLWPEDSYHVVVVARGHNKGESSELTGKAGETQDLGKIVLINTDASVAGRVVGADGQPIVGAEVFNRGDAPEPVAMATDSQGRFRLAGMLPGTRFIFVRKEGYRFTGVKNRGNADGMTIRLLRATEPPPAWKPVTTPGREEERAFAQQVLIRIWEKYGSRADNNGAFSCIRAMAEIDPDLALQWSAEKGHRYDDDVRFAEARKLAGTDAEDALGLLNQRPDSASQRVLQGLADRFAETDAKKALRFAEEAAVQARGLNQPDRALAMARAGAVLVKLGRVDVGRKLIEEAARDAAQLPAVNRAGFYRGLISGILAPYDVERALALVEPIKTENQEGPRNRARIAAAIATTDTKRAVELVETVGGNAFYHEMARTAIAYQIGRDHPDEAIKIIEDMKRDPATIWQAEAYGWLAVALAPRDRARANALIDRALAMMIFQRDWAGRSDWSGGEMAGAAHVALCARRIGYPDMESVVMRVIAARPTDGRGASTHRTRLGRAVAVSTVSLALVDPEAARTVLEQLESRAGFDLAAEWSTREPWLIAWALVDLQKAREVFESTLASLDQQKDVNLWSTGFFEMVELLTAAPDRREAILSERAGAASWRPGGEL